VGSDYNDTAAGVASRNFRDEVGWAHLSFWHCRWHSANRGAGLSAYAARQCAASVRRWPAWRRKSHVQRGSVHRGASAWQCVARSSQATGL